MKPSSIWRNLLCLTLCLLCLIPATAQQGGRLEVHYEPPQQELHQLMEAALKEGGFLELIANEFNQTFRLPRTVWLGLAELGQENAFYSPDKHVVVLSYELIAAFFRHSNELGLSGQDQVNYVTGAVVFVVFHELGHCLVNEWNIPITGREEDAVDDFSALLMAEAGLEGQECLAYSSLWFGYMGQQEAANGVSGMPYWDEHSLGLQRFYNVLYILYGSAPTRWEQILVDAGVPRQRMERALRDYPKKKAAWETLLGPYRR